MTNEISAGGQLAIAQALYKLAGAAVKTHTPDNLRGAVDEELYELHETNGVTAKDLDINGVKVGKVSLTEKGEPVIVDNDAFEPWAIDSGRMRQTLNIYIEALPLHQQYELYQYVRDNYPQAVDPNYYMMPEWQKGLFPGAIKGVDDAGNPLPRYVIDSYGEIVPGLEWRTTLSTRVSDCAPEKVAEALRAGLPVGDAIGLLMSGGEYE